MTFGRQKLHYSETAESPVIPGRLNAPQSHQTPMNLYIYMGTGTVALCKTDPITWAQTLMPPHPVEAHFDNSYQQFRRGYPGHSYAAPSTAIQERMPWTFLCGSLHSSSGEDTLDIPMRLPPQRVHE